MLADALEQPFSYGHHDCGLMAIAAAEAITGRVPAAWLREADYSTEDELEALLTARGGLEAAVGMAMQEFGAEEIPVPFAQRGDWVLLRIGNEFVTGVVAGARAAAPGLDGMRMVPMRCAFRAWAV